MLPVNVHLAIRGTHCQALAARCPLNVRDVLLGVTCCMKHLPTRAQAWKDNPIIPLCVQLNSVEKCHYGTNAKVGAKWSLSSGCNSPAYGDNTPEELQYCGDALPVVRVSAKLCGFRQLLLRQKTSFATSHAKFPLTVAHGTCSTPYASTQGSTPEGLALL